MLCVPGLYELDAVGKTQRPDVGQDEKLWEKYKANTPVLFPASFPSWDR